MLLNELKKALNELTASGGVSFGVNQNLFTTLITRQNPQSVTKKIKRKKRRRKSKKVNKKG